MSAQKQRWKPDTCECSVVEVFDDHFPELPPTLHTYEVKCAAHQGLSDADAFTAVLAENQQKNVVWNEAVEALGVHHQDVEWAFDATRDLVLTVNPKPKPVEHIILDLQTAVKLLMSGKPVDPNLVEPAKVVSQKQKDDLATALKGKATVR